VFVAGATGRLGARIVRELLGQGFRVRAGVRNADKAETYLAIAASYGLLSKEELGRLQVRCVCHALREKAGRGFVCVWGERRGGGGGAGAAAAHTGQDHSTEISCAAWADHFCGVLAPWRLCSCRSAHNTAQQFCLEAGGMAKRHAAPTLLLPIPAAAAGGQL
jgi:NAD(P)-dependent dehydrogenase (short-subunit alcohol dehydrogenase family)